MTTDLQWWTFEQNNSGGYFITNEDVGDTVFFQANSFASMIENAHNILDNHSQYCDCCGERWDFPWHELDEAGTEEPTIGKTVLTECLPEYFRSKAVLHYANGDVKYYLLGVGFVDYDTWDGSQV